MRFDYTADAILVRDMVRDFIDSEVRPRVMDYERKILVQKRPA